MNGKPNRLVISVDSGVNAIFHEFTIFHESEEKKGIKTRGKTALRLTLKEMQ